MYSSFFNRLSKALKSDQLSYWQQSFSCFNDHFNFCRVADNYQPLKRQVTFLIFYWYCHVKKSSGRQQMARSDIFGLIADFDKKNLVNLEMISDDASKKWPVSLRRIENLNLSNINMFQNYIFLHLSYLQCYLYQVLCHIIILFSRNVRYPTDICVA